MKKAPAVAILLVSGMLVALLFKFKTSEAGNAQTSETGMFRFVDENEVFVNLDARPRQPFAGEETKLIESLGRGWIRVEKRKDLLYVNNRKVILYQSKRQVTGEGFRHDDLRKELSEKRLLHPNVLYALMKYPNLIPKHWQDGRHVMFLGALFRLKDTEWRTAEKITFIPGSVSVRGMFFSKKGKWTESESRLNELCYRIHFAAIAE